MIFKPPPRLPRYGGGVEYRLYFLDPAGLIEKSHEFEAKDDSHAIGISHGWPEGRAIELCQGSRLVLRLD